jgi:hypothetical protein
VKFIIILISSIVSLRVFGNGNDTLQNNFLLRNGPTEAYPGYFQYNPSATFLMGYKQYSAFYSGYSYSKADSGLHSVQEGNEFSEFQISTESFRKDSFFTFFGKAQYINDVRKKTHWSDVEDAALLAPYIIADSVGGDYKREKYYLEGGLSVHTARIDVGLRAVYDGSVSFREVDPRPRNTVSSFIINPGVTVTLNNIKLGWFGNYWRYRQNVDISVEKEDKKIYFYLLQGFGIYNRQFSEWDDTYTRIYKGSKVSSGFHLNYIKNLFKGGILFSAGQNRIDVSESDKRTPYKITYNNFSSELDVSQIFTNRVLYFHAGYSFLQSIGNETQYNPVTINSSYVSWQYATQSDRFESRLKKISMILLWGSNQTLKTSVWEQLRFEHSSYNQKYFTPDYYQNVKDIQWSGKVGITIPLKGLTIVGSGMAGIKRNLSSSLYQDENNIISNELVISDYQYLKTNFSFYQLKTGISIPVKNNIALTLNLSGDLKSAVNKNYYFVNTSVGLIF